MQRLQACFALSWSCEARTLRHCPGIDVTHLPSPVCVRHLAALSCLIQCLPGGTQWHCRAHSFSPPLATHRLSLHRRCRHCFKGGFGCRPASRQPLCASSSCWAPAKSVLALSCWTAWLPAARCAALHIALRGRCVHAGCTGKLKVLFILGMTKPQLQLLAHLACCQACGPV